VILSLNLSIHTNNASELAGAFFGSLIAYGSAYFLGRRKSLWFFAIIFQVGAGIMLASNHGNLTPILVGRVLAGIGVGGSSMIVPIYISELSPPAIRGRLVGIYEVGWQIGGTNCSPTIHALMRIHH